MKKGQLVEGIVSRVDFPNKGRVVTAEGEEVAVKHVIPGQRVSVLVTKVRKGRAEGRVEELICPAPLEGKSPCPHFGVCGGCSYLTLPYEEQLKLKEEQVRRLLEPVLGEQTWQSAYRGINKSPRQFGYRNKMEFSFGDEYKDGPLALGMHRRGSFYDLVTVDHCQIVDEDFRQILAETLAYFKDRGVPFLHRMSHEGYLRHLLVRKAAKTEEILVDLVTTGQEPFPKPEAGQADALREDSMAAELRRGGEDSLLEGWKEAILSLAREKRLSGSLAGILHTRNDSLADVVQNDGTELLFGRMFFTEELLGLRFTISPFSFFQTNSLGAEVLYRIARDFILSDGREALEGKLVYDLYSGTGTIAQMLAPVCRKVVGVEIVEEAVEAARKSAAENGLRNCEFLAGDVLKVLDTIEEQPDFIVLDPPRDGVNPKALEKIIACGVDRMIYISCKPTSLARDLELLTARGYRVTRIELMDMFPGGFHIETVVQLVNIGVKPDFTVDVEVDVDEMYRKIGEDKRNYIHSEEYKKIKESWDKKK